MKYRGPPPLARQLVIAAIQSLAAGRPELAWTVEELERHMAAREYRVRAAVGWLVHMCHYLSGSAPSKTFAAFTMGHLELAEMAQAAQVRNLVLSHVTTQFDRPGLREHVIREVGNIYRGNIFFGEDLMEIPFGSPKATRLD